MKEKKNKNDKTEEFIDVNSSFEKEKQKQEKKVVTDKQKLVEAYNIIADWENEYAKLLADTQNLRKTLEKDQREFVRYRAAGFIEGLIPVLDSFEFAFKIEPPSKETQNYLLGFKMIYQNLLNVLLDEGITIIKPLVGSEFDSNTMEASDSVESDDYEDNAIVSVNLAGYKMHERLIRPASVTVNRRQDISKK